MRAVNLNGPGRGLGECRGGADAEHASATEISACARHARTPSGLMVIAGPGVHQCSSAKPSNVRMPGSCDGWRAVNLVSRITLGLRESGYKAKPLLFKMLIEGEGGIDP
jgi:hypothetical protein